MLMRAAAAVGSMLAYLTTPRSPHWPAVRQAHLMREPECQWCGADENLAVHHILPYHVDKTKELESSNLITLCDDKENSCHYRIGHLGRGWLAYDPDVREKCEQRKWSQ